MKTNQNKLDLKSLRPLPYHKFYVQTFKNFLFLTKKTGIVVEFLRSNYLLHNRKNYEKLKKSVQQAKKASDL